MCNLIGANRKLEQVLKLHMYFTPTLERGEVDSSVVDDIRSALQSGGRLQFMPEPPISEF